MSFENFLSAALGIAVALVGLTMFFGWRSTSETARGIAKCESLGGVAIVPNPYSSRVYCLKPEALKDMT